MHTKLIKMTLTISCVLLLFACGSTKHSFDFDSNVDFSQLKTYQWNNQPSADFSKANPLIDKRIIKAIEDSMKRKGITKADSADIKISYSVSYEKKLKTGGLTAGIGMSVGKSNRGHIGLSSGNQLRQTTVGTLMIDMASTKNNSLIWRSKTTKPISDREATPEESQKRISQLVYSVFENFPPK